jgi:hypothetical protein
MPHLHNASTNRDFEGRDYVGQLPPPSAVPRMTPAIREPRASPGRPVTRMRGIRLTWSPAIRELGNEPAARRPRPRLCDRWPGRSWL